RHPDTPVRNDRRGPPEPWYDGFPDDVVRFAPLNRKTALSRVALARGAAKLRPLLHAEGDRKDSEQQRQHPQGVHRTIVTSARNASAWPDAAVAAVESRTAVRAMDQS